MDSHTKNRLEAVSNYSQMHSNLQEVWDDTLPMYKMMVNHYNRTMPIIKKATTFKEATHLIKISLDELAGLELQVWEEMKNNKKKSN